MKASDRYMPGLGFNPAFLSGAISWPKACRYLEAGTSVVMKPDLLREIMRKVPQVSLHLARVPMCEPEIVQDAFLDGLFESLPPGLHSIGVHLCGPYQQDMGHLGLSTMFHPNSENRTRAERFLSLAKARADEHSCAFLVENANFYEDSAESALDGIQYVGDLCTRLGVDLILDVAHLVMAAHNVGLEPNFFLGRFPLRHVKVIHLSGIREGRNGVYHDGHNLPVHETVWALAEMALAFIRHSVHVVLEHTDGLWAERTSDFAEDFRRLEGLLSDRMDATIPRPPRISLEEAAVGYLSNVVLPRRCPKYFVSLSKEESRRMVRLWAEDFLRRVKSSPVPHYVILRKEDWFSATRDACDPVADFERWCANEK